MGFTKIGGIWVSKDGDQAGSSSEVHIGEEHERKVVATENEPVGAHEAGPSDVNMEERIVEQDALMSPNPSRKLEDLAAVVCVGVSSCLKLVNSLLKMIQAQLNH